MAKRVLVTETIAEEGLEALERRGLEVDVRLDLTPEQLIEAIPPYDAIIVRSATRMTPEVIDAAGKCVLPGFVDAHSHIGGLAGVKEQDLNEITNPLTPELPAASPMLPVAPKEPLPKAV